MRLLLGLGGNLGDVRGSFAEVVRKLRERQWLLAASGLYRSRPVGPPQDDYLNGVLLVRLAEPVDRFLGRCQAWEAAAGRDRLREERWGPRTLDLDLLMAPDVVCRGPRLELPHPRFAERAFALVPAAELCPEWIHPLMGRSLAELARQAVADDPGVVQRLGEL